jgi:putative DNA primase/helicase
MGVDAKTLSGRNVPCPWCGGKDRFRFTNHEGAGVWVCNYCGQGNGFHFVQRWHGVDFKRACIEVAKVLPNCPGDDTPIKVTPSAKLNKYWRSPQQPDTLTAYLAGRGLELIDDSAELRCVSDMPYYHNGKHTASYDAMLARVRDHEGTPTTLHVTYLQDGMKAPVDNPKKVLSQMGLGAHIRLWPMKRDSWLNVTEGIETAIAVHAATWEPTWALISAGNMPKFKIPPGIAGLRIWADNDHSFTGQAAAYELARRAVNEGFAVAVNVPVLVDSDWADAENRDIMSAHISRRKA